MWHHVTASWAQDVILQKWLLLRVSPTHCAEEQTSEELSDKIGVGSHKQRASSLSHRGLCRCSILGVTRKNVSDSPNQASHWPIRSSWELSAGHKHC